MIFKIDCYDIFDNQEELEKVEEEVDELEEPVKDAITTFVNTERQRLENDYGCTIVKRQVSDKEIDLLRCMGLKKAAPGMGRLETQYGFLVQTTMAARSFPLTDTFSICPTANIMSTKSIGFTDVFVKTLLENLHQFRPDLDAQAVSNIQDAFSAHNGNSLQFLFNIAEKAVIRKDYMVECTKRRYDQKLQKTTGDSNGKIVYRFVQANRFTTDGIKCCAQYRDWCTPAKIDNTLHLLDVSTLCGRNDIEGFIGIDFGQRPAGFYLPNEERECKDELIFRRCMRSIPTSVVGIQTAIKRSELYGKQK